MWDDFGATEVIDQVFIFIFFLELVLRHLASRVFGCFGLWELETVLPHLVRRHVIFGMRRPLKNVGLQRMFCPKAISVTERALAFSKDL